MAIWDIEDVGLSASIPHSTTTLHWRSLLNVGANSSIDFYILSYTPIADKDEKKEKLINRSKVRNSSFQIERSYA